MPFPSALGFPPTQRSVSSHLAYETFYQRLCNLPSALSTTPAILGKISYAPPRKPSVITLRPPLLRALLLFSSSSLFPVLRPQNSMPPRSPPNVKPTRKPRPPFHRRSIPAPRRFTFSGLSRDAQMTLHGDAESWLSRSHSHLPSETQHPFHDGHSAPPTLNPPSISFSIPPTNPQSAVASA
jgi:hypothetical protein